MKDKTLALALVLLLLQAGCVSTALGHNAPFPSDYDYTHLKIDATCSPESFDPAWSYDTASAEVLINVYETLLFYSPLWELGPYQPDKPASQRTETFVPQIASALPTVETFDPPLTNPKSGLPIYKRFTFSIRTGVKFHHGPFADPDGSGPLMGSDGVLRPRDVEYSFERVLVQDRAGGPAWMLYEPLLGVYQAVSPVINPNWGLAIDGAVEIVGSSVQFNLAVPYPELAFKQILCNPCSSVTSEAWAANEGDLNMNGVLGGWSNWAFIYNTWYNPAASFLEDAVDRPDPLKDGGTGPYRMDYWTRSVAWSIRKFDDYVAPNENLGRTQSWPAPVTGSTAPLGGYLSTITWYHVIAWATRLADLLTGTRDIVDVPRNYRNQVLGQVVLPETGEKIRCHYPYDVLALEALFFNFNINPASTFVGTMQPPNTFSTSGIPPNIFGINTVTRVDEGINVRRAFSYAIDYALAITAGYLDEAQRQSDPIIQGLAYDDPTVPKPVYSLNAAEYYFRLAWGGVDGNGDYDMEDPEDTDGALWNGGMQFTCVYPIGSVPYQLALESLVPVVNSLNPGLFQLSIQDLDWGTRFLPDMANGDLPLFMSGWTADFTDPHNFIHPFMHSQGTYARAQRYNERIPWVSYDSFADDLIQQGILLPDSPYEDTIFSPVYTEYRDRDYNGALSIGDWINTSYQGWYEVTDMSPFFTAKLSRERVYFELQEYYVEQVPSIVLFQPVGRHWEQPWMRGWYYNPLHGGSLTPGVANTAPTSENLYFYHLWKDKTHLGDANWDGEVYTTDVSTLSAHWSGPPEGPGGYNLRADLTGGIGDIGEGDGTPPPGTGGLVRGIWDGRVDNIDKSLISGYWDGPPQGPSHP